MRILAVAGWGIATFYFVMLLFTASWREGLSKELKELKSAAVEKQYAEWITDGETITFQWK